MTMKKKSRWKILFVLSMFVIVMSISLGCSREAVPGEIMNEDEVQETEIKKEFRSDSGELAISATDLWSVDESLHDGSKLSLYNEEYQSYLIILTDKKELFSSETSLEHYGELVAESTMEGLEEGTVSETEKLEINGLEARSFSVSGLVDDISVTYKFLVLEDKSDFHQVVTWSFSENIENNPEYYDEILHSYTTDEVTD